MQVSRSSASDGRAPDASDADFKVRELSGWAADATVRCVRCEADASDACNGRQRSATFGAADATVHASGA